MCRLSSDGRSKALPHTWHGNNGRWRAGRPDEADETEVIPLARPPLPLVTATWWWWWWWLWINKVSDEASNPDVLLAISSAPDDSPADCSLETDWRPSEAPPEPMVVAPTLLLLTCCCCCCCCWASGVGDEAEQDDVKSERDKSRGLSIILDRPQKNESVILKKRSFDFKCQTTSQSRTKEAVGSFQSWLSISPNEPSTRACYIL